MTGLACYLCKCEPSVLSHFDFRSGNDSSNNDNISQDTHLGFLTITHVQKESRMKTIFSKSNETEKPKIPALSSHIYISRKVEHAVDLIVSHFTA